MSLSEFCIKRPVFTILLMLAIFTGGIAGYLNLPINALPNVDFPVISVSASLPGASPEVMASSVAMPLEKQFSTIEGIEAIASTSYLGQTQLTLQFNLNRKIDGAALDVQSAISSVLGKLPSEMPSPPTFKKVNPSDQPIFFLALTSSTKSLTDLTEFSQTFISQKLSTISGVGQVITYGSKKHAIRIRINPTKLAAYNLSFDDVIKCINNSTSIKPLGSINSSTQQFSIEINNQPFKAKEFESIILTYNNKAPIFLKDIAELEDGIEDEKQLARLNGSDALILAIQRQPGANTIEIIDNIKKVLPSLKETLPKGVEIVPYFDRSQSIRDSISDVQFTLYITIILVIFSIFLFLRKISAMVIPAVAVPLSLIATYGVMNLLGYSINAISLLALTLSIGFVVDDAIIMLENIVRYIEKGMESFSAAIKGSAEIKFTILSTTISLIAAFIPVLFMEGIVGRMFREFSVTICVAILVSGLIALTLTPMMCRFLLKPQTQEQLKNKKFAFLFKILEKALDKMFGFYKVTLSFVLEHQRGTLFVTLTTFFLTVSLYITIPKGFVPLEDLGFIVAQTEANQDISFDAMVIKQENVAKAAQENPFVEKVFINLGSGAPNTGRIFIGLKERSQRPSMEKVISQLREKFSHIEGVNVYMQPVQNLNFSSKSGKGLYQYVLQGTDFKELIHYSEPITKGISKIKGIVDVTSDLQLKSLQLNLKIDHKKAESLGVSFDQIRSVLYSAFGTEKIGTLYSSSNSYSVIIEVDKKHQQSIDNIHNLYARTSSGKMVELSSFIDFELMNAPLLINHQGQLPSVTITFNLAEGASIGDVVNEIKNIEKENLLPSSIVTSYQGSAQAFHDSQKTFVGLFLLAILTIYIILGMLYESFVHPLTILSGVPSAGIGALCALMLFKMNLDLPSAIGIIMLIGILKKNAIMIVDFAVSAKRDEQTSEENIIYKACLRRFRPIMMTTFSAILGVLPVAFGFGAGAEMRQPLGITVVGGLLVSQVLTLYMTPVIYLYLDRLGKRIFPKFSKINSNQEEAL